MASNTPWRLYKINTHAGGHSVPFICLVARRRRRRRRGRGATSGRTSPTCCRRCCELTGVDPPGRRATASRSSRSPAAAWCRCCADADAAAPPRRASTSRWPATAATTATAGRSSPATSRSPTFGDHEWELYDLAERPDRAARPRRRAPRAGGRAGRRRGRRRPGPTRCTRSTRGPGSGTSSARRTSEPLQEPVRILRRHPHARAVPLAAADPVAVVHRRRRAALPHRRHAACSFAHGDQGGGYALYVDDGDELVFVHNGYGTMTELRGGAGARRHRARSASTSPRPAAGRGTSRSSVDGEDARRATGPA